MMSQQAVSNSPQGERPTMAPSKPAEVAEASIRLSLPQREGQSVT